MLLKFLRKRKNMKMIMWGIAILIIPAFVIWGSGTSDKKKEGNKPDYAGRIFDKKISYDEYGDMWNVARDYAVKTFGNNAPAELIDQLAWDRIILLEDARRRKILVKDSEVVNAIASSPLFQKNGSFDKKLYKSMLGDAARAFEERLRDDLLISKLRETIIGPISISEDEAKKEFKKNFEKIKLSYIVMPFSDFEKDARYAEQDLLSFYDRNKNEFKKPEQVNVGYIEIPFAGFEPDTRVTDDEIKRYFEEHLSEFKKPDSDEAPALDDAIKNEITAKLSFKKKISMAEELAYKTLDEAIAKKELAAPARSNSLEVKETGLFTMQDEIPGIGWSYEF
ncbi:MAG: peptidylprolyl isomerase, partial [Candidatus Omnitrophota bacterium]